MAPADAGDFLLDEDDDDFFGEFNPHPYHGGYDLAATFGTPLPPSSNICYPVSSSAATAAPAIPSPPSPTPEPEEPYGDKEALRNLAHEIPDVFPNGAAREGKVRRGRWCRRGFWKKCVRGLDYLFGYKDPYGERRIVVDNYVVPVYANRKDSEEDAFSVEVEVAPPSAGIVEADDATGELVQTNDLSWHSNNRDETDTYSQSLSNSYYTPSFAQSYGLHGVLGKPDWFLNFNYSESHQAEEFQHEAALSYDIECKISDQPIHCYHHHCYIQSLDVQVEPAEPVSSERLEYEHSLISGEYGGIGSLFISPFYPGETESFELAPGDEHASFEHNWHNLRYRNMPMDDVSLITQPVMNCFALTASDPNNQPYFGLLNLPPKACSRGMEWFRLHKVYHSAVHTEGRTHSNAWMAGMELIDPVVDQRHRSNLQDGQLPLALRLRTHDELWLLDHRWVPRLRAAGLLPFARLVERHRHRSARFPVDRALLSAWVDRWRPETHTFHLPVGEVTVTLQDVAMLFGLPLAGAPVGPTVVAGDWGDQLLHRFQGAFQPAEGEIAEQFGFHDRHGPPKAWLSQFRAERLTEDDDDWRVQQHLEAYLLWLFGWVLFTSSHHDTVDKHLIHYAAQIAYAPVEAIPQYSWGSAVLAATYRALCDACTRRTTTGTFAGCPLLVMLWSFERFDIGRPALSSYELYNDGMYAIDQVGVADDLDAPTMGTLWLSRDPRWATGTGRGTYNAYVAALDQLTADRVRWTPYIAVDLQDRAPRGLSEMCYHDQELWCTRRRLVFDIFVEPYCPKRVARQFGRVQVFPFPDFSWTGRMGFQGKVKV